MSKHLGGLPTIDVVIPNYNYGRYLLACAESVLSQSGVHVRLLIIDNASQDESVDIARDLASSDGRVEVILRSRNLGPHASFNEGIDWARSDYFLILCADDLLNLGALLRATYALEHYPNVHLACGATRNVTDEKRLSISRMDENAHHWKIWSGMEFIKYTCTHAFNPVAGPTAVVRTAVQKQIGYYRKTLKHTDDLEMWLRFAAHGSIASTSNIQAYARIHPNNQSAMVAGTQNWNDEFEAAFKSFFSHEGQDIPSAEQLIKSVRQCLSKRAYWSALSDLSRLRTGSASLMFNVLKRDPLMALIPPLDYLMLRLQRRHIIF